MRTKKTVQVPASQKEVIDKVTCDICGTEAIGHGWDASYYECNETELEVTVRQRAGDTHHDGGWGTEYVVDMCPKCFVERLIPWIREQGGNVEEQEWDY